MFRKLFRLFAIALPLFVLYPGAAVAEQALKPSGSIESARVPAEPLGEGERFGSKLQIKIDREKVDLERHRLEVQVNRPVSRVELTVVAENEEVLAQETFQPKTSSADEPIPLRWSQQDKTPIARIDIKAWDTEDNWVAVRIIPWSVTIPHEEVNFETDKATIQKSEIHKLQDSLERINAAIQRYRELGKIQLFIAGHTDTVGSPSYNLDLSRRRAQSIAAWFVKNGLTIPVAFDGFGESAPLVETKDEVDEPRNRRVDYILAVEAPVSKKGRSANWRYLNRAK